MKIPKLIFIVISTLVFSVFIFSACSKDSVAPDEEEPQEEEEGPREGVFVLAAKKGLAGADILLTSNTLDEGEISTSGTGVEQSGSDRTYFVKNDMIFSFMFGGSAAGAVTAYKVNASKQLEKVTDFQTETLHTYGGVGDDILMIKNSWQAAEEYMQWYRFDTKKLEIVALGEINTKELAGKQKNEMAFFTDIKQVGDKVFAPFWSIQSGQNFRTSNPDSTFIAVFSYPDMKLEKVIKDARTGSIGAYFRSGMEVDENGDVYVIGTKLGPDSDGQYSTKTPVAFTKIKNGTTEYDKSYFFNITEASGGKYIFQKLYLGEGNFLLVMGDQPNTYGTTMYLYTPISFAIANVYDASYRPVTGANIPASIYRTTEYSYNYSPLDGKTGYIGINTLTDPGAIYKFDAETATATPALKVDAGGFTSISWVPVSE